MKTIRAVVALAAVLFVDGPWLAPLTADAIAQRLPDARLTPPQSTDVGPQIQRRYSPTPGREEADAIEPSGGAASPVANVTYHGGRVMTAVTTYTIFWQPPGRYMSPSYKTLINRYFQDIGGSNFFNIATQYTKGQGSNTFKTPPPLEGPWLDASPYPNASFGFDLVFDSDLQKEVQKAIAANHWPTGANVMFFVYLARGVESCVDDFSLCTPGEAQMRGTPGFCGYHAAFGTVAQPVIWANIPYGATWNGPARCSTLSRFPNDPDADITISVTSHEHFEAVTDPFGDGWTDVDPGSGEIGDKCAYRFEPVLSDGGNVTLNGHRYVVQAEWSNAAFNGLPYSGCALASTSPPKSQVRGDFDGDGLAELTVFRPSTGTWYSRLSSLGYSATNSWAVQWGLPGDIPLNADFEGDGATDLVVWRPSTGTWYVRYSSLGYDIATFGQFQWGLAGDVPLVADFDGDGKADLVVWRPSNGTWYVRYSSTGYDVNSARAFQWGLPGDVPLAADFDGDGITDLTVWRPSTGTWFSRLSSLGFSSTNVWVVQWGLPGDIPLVADFDGDRVTDLTVYRPSTGEWFSRLSSLGFSDTNFWQVQWGLPGDVPTARDVDGDGRTDLVVFRPSQGGWFIRLSSNGDALASYQYFQWGLPGDVLAKP